ncbi:60S ribosomal subunit assembly or modification protein [Sorochytrium milnesiophthora]
MSSHMERDQHDDGDMSDIEETDAYVHPDAVEEVVDTADNAPEPVDSDGDDDMDTNDADEDDGMMEMQDDSVQGFFEHKKPVYAVAIHPTDPALVLSGGENDTAYLWNATNGERIHTFAGHTDSVIAVGFNHDGSMCATGGMDGAVRVWQVATGELLVALEGPEEVVWLQWHQKGNALLVGSSDGQTWLFLLPAGSVHAMLTGVHTQSVLCGTFSPDGRRVLTGGEDGSFAVWEPNTSTSTIKWQSHDARWLQEGVTSIGVNPAGTVAVVGGSEGNARLVNLTNGHLLSSLALHSGSLESVIVSPSLPFAALASADGSMTILDLNTIATRLTVRHDDAIVKAQWTADGLYVVSVSTDHTVRVWDARTGAQIKVWRGHMDPIQCFAMTPQGDMVVSGGDDGVCLVFRVNA